MACSPSSTPAVDLKIGPVRPEPGGAPCAATGPSPSPAGVLGGVAAATIMVGALAGAYPATRAARLSPTAALAAM
jgi:ABC-type antimicrobial peptide transport system permease subunit